MPHAPAFFEATESYAQHRTQEDPLARFRNEFIFPKRPHSNQDALYFLGNSLGLQPKKARDYVNTELDHWAELGVSGHFASKHPWMTYHELLNTPMSRIVGALPSEVILMNTLTVNLHLMLTSFYCPTRTRNKILMEKGAFPSDQYAVASQVRWHAQHLGLNPADTIVELAPRPGESLLRNEDILEKINSLGNSLCTVLLGQVNYLTGQEFDIPSISEAGHRVGAIVGVDLAHGAGNLELKLHDWNVDFAVWCTYKYLNSGPGALAGCYVHERHHSPSSGIPRLEGWYGNRIKTRFKMAPIFDAAPGAEAWQLSNPPILSMAPIRAALEIFEATSMTALRQKSRDLTQYLEFLLQKIGPPFIEIVTPSNPEERGAQLSVKVKNPRELVAHLEKQGIFADFREPHTVRFAPTPLYNNFTEVFQLYSELNIFFHC